MPGFVRSLLRPGGYRGLPYAVLGAAMTVPVAPFAMPWALLSPAGRPRVLLALTALAALLGLLGLLGPVRRFGVAAANGLLGTSLPSPGRARPAWPERLRSGPWLVLHAAFGGLLLVRSTASSRSASFPSRCGCAAIRTSSLFFGDDRRRRIVDGAGSRLVMLSARAAGSRPPRPAASGPARKPCWARPPPSARRSPSAAPPCWPSATGWPASCTTRSGTRSRRRPSRRRRRPSLVETDPAQVRRALGTIEEASRSALEDLDHVLGLLREEPAAKEPTRTLTEVDVLAVRAREAGLDVRLTVRGPVAALPAAVSREGYRIVQEGLTNALRHAGPGAVDVRVEAGPDQPGDRGRQRAARRSGRGRGGAGWPGSPSASKPCAANSTPARTASGGG